MQANEIRAILLMARLVPAHRDVAAHLVTRQAEITAQSAGCKVPIASVPPEQIGFNADAVSPSEHSRHEKSLRACDHGRGLALETSPKWPPVFAIKGGDIHRGVSAG